MRGPMKRGPLWLRTWAHQLKPLEPGLTVRCSGVQPKKGEPRCSGLASYRAEAGYVTGPRGRESKRFMYYCSECASKWARWMEIGLPELKGLLGLAREEIVEALCQMQDAEEEERYLEEVDCEAVPF